MPHTDTLPESDRSAPQWRIYGLSVEDARSFDWSSRCKSVSASGFDTLSVPFESIETDDLLKRCASACRVAGLRMMLDCPPQAASGDCKLGQALARLGDDGPAIALLLRGIAQRGRQAGRDHLTDLRERYGQVRVTVWTPGMTPLELAALEGLALDGVYASLPWWNCQDDWLIEEYLRLRAVAPVIAPLADPRNPDIEERGAARVQQRLAMSAMLGGRLLFPARLTRVVDRDVLESLMALAGQAAPQISDLRRLTGPQAPLSAWFERGNGGQLLVLNPDAVRPGAITRGLIEHRLPGGFVLEAMETNTTDRIELPGGGWEFIPLTGVAPVAQFDNSSRQQRGSLARAMRSPRIAIETVRPVVDNGRFAAKRSLGETVSVSANIFMDGHEELAAEVLWRPLNHTEWYRVPMRPLGNDVWEARFRPRKLGRHEFMIRAWHDEWRSFCVQLQKKVAAGVDVRLEVEEGRRTLQHYLERARSQEAVEAEAIEAAMRVIGAPTAPGMVRQLRPSSGAARAVPLPAQGIDTFPSATPEQVAAVLDESLAEVIERVGPYAFETRTPIQYPLSVESVKAMFSSWYELFPRSQSQVAGRHGTLQDVIRRLPQIRRMGFDVLYFPPIHPIGERNRKGRNNSLEAEPGDPGSPYAIGSAHGGHDAVHPELGTLDEFRELVVAARAQGLEIALDFAIQCSPDHPWLREHPEWFNWRADGSLKHAENPPKRYEDIVNPDFYSPLASTPRQAALWRALRDIVLFWVQQGVRIFRVDNPHTKPLPFWEWMLREVRDRHPETVFLSEAFTRPAMMYRLAKLGFSQSYTYFTWRNSRQELTDYLTELNSEPVRDFFRPNFFVNTPDINPWFLQTSGRAGFLIRAVLAGTLSGAWGMYNGFELCVADPVPGKEEYLDSEKYQFRHWDLAAPGNIIAEITRLNHIRRSHPALQSHLGIRFLNVDNEQILFYLRQSDEGDSAVLVAVSLDPHQRQSGRLELPLESWSLADNAALALHDLFEDRRFVAHGRWHQIELTPERPFALWARVKEAGERA